jgi:hypothetical protein
MTNVWSYPDDVWVDGTDVVGYDVAATDGDIGKIDDATADVGRQHIVVDTGFWIFGKRRLIPAGAITRIDHEDEKVYVNLTKDQIKDAPDYDDQQKDDEAFYERHDEFYGPFTW